MGEKAGLQLRPSGHRAQPEPDNAKRCRPALWQLSIPGAAVTDNIVEALETQLDNQFCRVKRSPVRCG